MHKIIFSILISLLLSSSLYAQDDFDSCNCEANRILNTFEKLKPKYIARIKDSLKVSLNRDSIYKKNKLKENELNLDTFIYKINPILKLKPQAIYYTKNENLCKYFEFDTIQFDCEAGIFLNNDICFYCRLGDQACNNEPFYFFLRYYCYYNKQEEDFTMLRRKVRHKDIFLADNYFKFYVKGIDPFFFKISNGKMAMELTEYSKVGQHNENIEEYIRGVCTERLARYLARQCSICGSPPWWKFWEWEIFHNRDGRGVGE